MRGPEHTQATKTVFLDTQRVWVSWIRGGVWGEELRTGYILSLALHTVPRNAHTQVTDSLASPLPPGSPTLSIQTAPLPWRMLECSRRQRRDYKYRSLYHLGQGCSFSSRSFASWDEVSRGGSQAHRIPILTCPPHEQWFHPPIPSANAFRRSYVCAYIWNSNVKNLV